MGRWFLKRSSCVGRRGDHLNARTTRSGCGTRAVCARCARARFCVGRASGRRRPWGCALTVSKHAWGARTWLRPGTEPSSPRVGRPQQAAGLGWDGPHWVLTQRLGANPPAPPAPPLRLLPVQPKATVPTAARLMA